MAAPILLFVKYVKRRENYWKTEAVAQKWYVKKAFLKISQNLQENTCNKGLYGLY